MGSCDKRDDADLYRFPLFVGSYWKYQVTRTNNSVDPPQLVVDTLQVWAEAPVQSPSGESCTVLRGRYNTEESDLFEYVANRQDGFYALGYRLRQGCIIPLKGTSNIRFTLLGNPVKEDDKDITWYPEPMLQMPYEAYEGKVWFYESSVIYPSSAGFFLQKRRLVQVPWGTKIAHVKRIERYGCEMPDAEINAYYTSVGVIKWSYVSVVNSENDTVSHIWELLEYRK
ncbi:MAG: hypothetical protein Q8M98_00870 [Candidatus Cloacimonadaceae bacterium]|nr:hypothetical protein [Candidatus Cloacimonadaceae bacterium]MDP3113301.1 hypothetical protein [Candidatus Cloacimonadaceae bacterium]